MSGKFYLKLAADNIKKNRKNYVPYILTSSITVAMFYIIMSLSQNEGLRNLPGAVGVAITLGLGSVVTAIFSVIFLFYTNSFLMKRRKKEFGLFNILGMEKRHIAGMIGIETLYVFLIMMIVGFAVGMSLDKLMFLSITRILDTDIPIKFYISSNAVIGTIILFAGVNLLIFLNSIRQIGFSKPIELLHSKNTGEKEPKSKWIIALLGALFLSAGYIIALRIKDPVVALFTFFIAVICVIIGTYLIFTAGSIVFLKILRKNKRIFYKTRNFISISGMIYRMKQNAVGLANICILSTMVLVMISSTVSLMIGIDDITNSISTYDFGPDCKQELRSMYGGLMFIGIFLGVLFTMAAILIIYYKQISEGYDDKERFDIMQKVGLSREEVKKSIRSQILTVFFMPPVTAGIHLIFAFPMISKILECMYLYNVALYIKCTVCCYIVYLAIYAVVYLMTAKTYYKIVKR